MRVRLQEQPFQILFALLERPGEVVLREEIRARLWPDATIVEFDHSINAAVKRLRDALGESAENPRNIETVARRGYRFKGQVDVSPAEPPNNQAESTSEARLNADPAAPATVQRSSRGILISAALFAVLLAAAGSWLYYRAAPARWAHRVAVPEADRLATAGRYPAAFELIIRARQLIPDDPALNRVLREISHPVSIHSSPSGAQVYVKAYDNADGQWLSIGRTPMENFLLPLGYYRWKLEKSGFRTVEAAAGIQSLTINFTLDQEGSVPVEMIHVPRDDFPLFSLKPVHLDDYWMDKHEVSNKQYKQFIDSGGYQNRKFWREEFIREGQVLSWEHAMKEFRDVTGRPGPSTWEAGSYPSGQDDFPVSGVSWYEASAYSEFAQKRLPTVYHWFRAASLGIWSDILHFSNFERIGTERAGARAGVGPFGTLDMAGNVREWCSNATGKRRYILGGAWNDERFVYSNMTSMSPFDRSAANGFRCVKYFTGALPDVLTEPVENPSRDRRKEKPATDEVYRILQSLYSYDRTDLRAVTESLDDSSAYWRAEKIKFNASYDRQRVIAVLYVPKSVKGPYQTIIFFPPRSARFLAKIDESDTKRIEFLMKTGRAVLFPTYQGTYERRPSGTPGPNAERDLVIQQSKDLRRSIDYLETRSDIAHDRLGYYGLSDGARLGVIMVAQEPRIRAAVFSQGGLSPERKLPEIDEINFANRVRVPVLMLNGRYDLLYPAETDQIPMFRLLGTPDDQKKYVLFDTGHILLQQQDMKETLLWFDKYLGTTGR